MQNMNSGYKGYSMSVRASQAYDAGEMPESKWTKSAIIEAVEDAMLEKEIPKRIDLSLLKKFSLKELRSMCLESRGWHHTSSRLNITYFYGLDINYLSTLTNEDIKERLESSKNNKKNKVKAIKLPPKPNMFITAKVEYEEWVGRFRNYMRKKTFVEVVKYRSNDKMVRTKNGTKRLSSLKIIKKLEQKTKYAPDSKVM